MSKPTVEQVIWDFQEKHDLTSGGVWKCCFTHDLLTALGENGYWVGIVDEEKK